MIPQNPVELGDTLGVLMGPVTAGDDEFADRPIEMAAPVGHETVEADGWGVIEVTALASVGDERMEGDALHRRDFVDGDDKAVLWIKGIEAVRHTLELHACE